MGREHCIGEEPRVPRKDRMLLLTMGSMERAELGFCIVPRERPAKRKAAKRVKWLPAYQPELLLMLTK